MLENAARICEAKFGVLILHDERRIANGARCTTSHLHFADISSRKTRI